MGIQVVVKAWISLTLGKFIFPDFTNLVVLPIIENPRQLLPWLLLFV